MRPLPRFLLPSLLVGLVACNLGQKDDTAGYDADEEVDEDGGDGGGGGDGGDGGGGDGGDGGGSGDGCSVELGMPDGSTTSFSCVSYTMDATFEFDPDDPPELRTVQLQLEGSKDLGFDCRLNVSIVGVCGASNYEVGDAATVSVETHDCTGVEDLYETDLQLTEGWVGLTRAYAGSSPGDFTGEFVQTQLAGTITGEAVGGWTVDASFDLTDDILGRDDEESHDCAGTANPGAELSGHGTITGDFEPDYEAAGYNDCEADYELVHLSSDVSPGCPDCDITGTVERVWAPGGDCLWVEDGQTYEYGLDFDTETLWFYGGEWTPSSYEVVSTTPSSWTTEIITFDPGYTLEETRVLTW